MPMCARNRVLSKKWAGAFGAEAACTDCTATPEPAEPLPMTTADRSPITRASDRMARFKIFLLYPSCTLCAPLAYCPEDATPPDLILSRKDCARPPAGGSRARIAPPATLRCIRGGTDVYIRPR